MLKIHLCRSDQIWLVVCFYPSETYEFVDREDEIPSGCGKISQSCSSHHQPGTIGMMKFPTEWKIGSHVPSHQPDMVRQHFRWFSNPRKSPEKSTCLHWLLPRDAECQRRWQNLRSGHESGLRLWDGKACKVNGRLVFLGHVTNIYGDNGFNINQITLFGDFPKSGNQLPSVGVSEQPQ